MDTHADQQPPTVSDSYARAELARAFATALGHRDPDTRARAETRAERWRSVLSGMADGRLRIGSRTPVAGLPAWVTPEVVRGGFATGKPAAGGPLLPYEREAAHRAGILDDRLTRIALFDHHLTEPGLTELWELLDTGRYQVALPEEAVLLTVAWLVRAGEVAEALALVEEVRPYADRLRFLPRPSDLPVPDARAVHRITADDAGAALSGRGPHDRIEARRESLAVWQPFTDELLTHWLRVREPDGTARTGGPTTEDPAWREHGAALLRRYRALAEEHTRCTKHLRPRENPALLRAALEEAVAGRPLDARRAGLLRHAIASMVRKRGMPGSPGHSALRAAQARQAALPAHHRLARLVAARLFLLPEGSGVPDTAPLVAPVTEAEAASTGLPAGAEIPPALRATVESALSAPLAVLVDRRVVPSAEVLAELVPQLVAATTADAYRDGALRTLMAAAYRAFRNRRSLLLLNLERQVRMDELPWIRAVAGQRGDGDTAREPARAALRELAELAVTAFPATILPNPLIRELSVLARQSGLGAPLTEELAADIFMGEFSPKFPAAAAVAGELLQGTLYERYYGIDYAAVRDLAAVEAAPAPSPDRGARRSHGPRTAPAFARLCAERSGSTPYTSVAANGTVIEQAQILTTHNLATLVARVGIAPEPGFDALAERCFDEVYRLVSRARGMDRPLATLKDAAYAWRQLVFHLSLCTETRQAELVAALPARAARHPAEVAARLAPALAGLRLVAAGGTFDPDGTADDGRARRLVGWTTGRHWLRGEPGGNGGRNRAGA